MMKCAKYIITLSVVLMIPFSMSADSRVEQAQKAYEQELYTQALGLYLDAERNAGTSSQLCYNIGNTYYRLKDTGHAILYYERALLLDPANSDARYNLDFVRQKSGIRDEGGSSYFLHKIDMALSRLSSNMWAGVALVAFLLFLAGVAAYVFGDRIAVRKIGFFGAIIMVMISAFANYCAFKMRNKVVCRNEAVVMPDEVSLGTSPRAPKDKGEIAFKLIQGNKVEVLDSVRVGHDAWLNVKTGDNRRAWLNRKDVEII